MTLTRNFLEKISRDQKRKRANKINDLYYLRKKNLKIHSPELDKWLCEMEKER